MDQHFCQTLWYQNRATSSHIPALNMTCNQVAPIVKTCISPANPQAHFWTRNPRLPDLIQTRTRMRNDTSFCSRCLCQGTPSPAKPRRCTVLLCLASDPDVGIAAGCEWLCVTSIRESNGWSDLLQCTTATAWSLGAALGGAKPLSEQQCNIVQQ